MIIDREIEKQVLSAAKYYPVVTITGSRQSGKTTLAKKLFPNKAYYNLEQPDIRLAIESDPLSFLANNPEGAIIDEIQRIPNLVSYIQPQVDKSQMKGQFILTGSNQFSLANSISQSLAGRTAIIKLLPFSIAEASQFKFDQSYFNLIFTGFYPGIYADQLPPTMAYRNYYETYIERDLRQLINIKDLSLFQKFIRLCAGRIGNIFNMNQLANETGVSVKTIQSWASILEASYILFFLQPWHSNIGKRLIKSPKLYFYDVGLASFLLGIDDANQLKRDPLTGQLFENMVIVDLMKQQINRGKESHLYFYRDSNMNEVDLLIKSGSYINAIEIKSSTTFNPQFLRSLDYLKRVLPEAVTNTYLIYNGNNLHQINNHHIVNFLDFQSL